MDGIEKEIRMCPKLEEGENKTIYMIKLSISKNLIEFQLAAKAVNHWLLGLKYYMC
jgi:hypothetical protein